MAFYDLTKEQRAEVVNNISASLAKDFERNSSSALLKYFSNADTYIRKAAYLATGKIYFIHPELQSQIIKCLFQNFLHEDLKCGNP